MPSQILDEKEIQQFKNAYMSDRTTYVRSMTEIEPKQFIITDEFLQRNANQLGFADKWTPLANFVEPKEKHLHKLKMSNAMLALNNGQVTVAEETLISAWDDIQVSRGDHGFFQDSLNKEIHEIHEDKTTDMEKKVGILGSLFKKKEPKQQVAQQQ